jgi:hypothetical protein
MRDIPVTSDRVDRRVGQMLCFVGAIGLFVCTPLALQKFGATPVELVLGLLAAIAAATSMVTLGIVIGLRRPE